MLSWLAHEKKGESHLKYLPESGCRSNKSPLDHPRSLILWDSPPNVSYQQVRKENSESPWDILFALARRNIFRPLKNIRLRRDTGMRPAIVVRKPLPDAHATLLCLVETKNSGIGRSVSDGWVKSSDCWVQVFLLAQNFGDGLLDFVCVV